MTFSIKWAGPPASYTSGRPRALRYIVLHTTEGSEGPNAAEDGNAYDKRRTDGVSTHYFTDSSGAAVQEVRDEDTAHAALYHGNAIGIQIEICGRAGQSAAQWADPVSAATLETTAQLVAHLCKTHGIPPVRLSVDQCRASWYAASDKRPMGIVDHYTVTRAYPEDGGTHTDVGPHFPWSDFLARVNELVEGNDVGIVEGITKDGLKDVVKTDDAVPNLPWRTDYLKFDAPEGATGPQGGTNRFIMLETWFDGVGQFLFEQSKLADQRHEELQAQIDALKAAIEGGVTVSPVVKVDPESVAAIADATADEIHADPERDGV